QARTTRLAARRWKEREVRSVPVSADDLDAAMRDLAKWARELPRAERERAEVRRRALADEVTPGTLAATSRAFASILLDAVLGFAPSSVFGSELVAAGVLDVPMNAVLGSLHDVVAVIGDAIDALHAADVDPVLKPLPDDYLPLHVACSRDGARRRLRHLRAGADHVGVSACPCGQEDRFHLGAGTLSLGALAGTDRWSPDVTLPVYLNGVSSGVVVGRSSALYGIVLNQVVEKVLGEPPVPMLIPPDLASALDDQRRPDSLLFDYLTAP
ncbi:MAG TPA: hypothetical protein VKA30_00070, partial [Actinomycetota bacterium]|nr:hypothetical protein [Actinomycetota bacterium]